MRAAAAAALIGTMAFAARAETAAADRRDGGARRESSFTIAVPNTLVILYSPAGMPMYSAAPATPPGDTSTFSLPGPAVSRGPEVSQGPAVSAGPEIGAADAGPTVRGAVAPAR